MKKLRFALLVAVACLGISACTGSPVGPDDCSVQQCIKPTSGS